MTLKGYPDRKKSDTGANNYATVAPVREGQFGLDVAAAVYFQVIGADAAEALSTTRIIVATAHAALVGDVISWTSGTLNTKEYRVAAVSTNAITVCEDMSVAPTAADTFNILRQKAPKVDSAGALLASFDSSLLATAAKQDTMIASLASIDAGTAASLGQKTMANSAPVVIASDQTAVPVSGTFWQATQPISGSVTISDGSGPVTVDGTVAASNLPATVDTNTGAAGASTPRVVLATRHEAVATPVAVQLSNGTNAIAYGTGADGATVPRQTLSTRHEGATTPVSVRATDGTNFYDPPSKGKAYADSVRYAYSSGAVATVSWVQLIASTAADINALFIFDSSGQTLELGTGGAGSESRKLIIPPGGLDGPVPLRIVSGTRVAIRALSATTGAIGEINITGLT